MGINFQKYKLHQNIASSKVIRRDIKYTLNYTSLIPPFSLKQTRLLNLSKLGGSRKLLVKQSYLLITWISYLTKQLSTEHNGDKSDLGGSSFTPRPGFFVQPTRVYKTTMTKAPMAHKTFSQEQYLVKFYRFSISFNFQPAPTVLHPSFNESIYILLKFRSLIFGTNSNLLFLKKTQLSLAVSDSKFITTTIDL